MQNFIYYRCNEAKKSGWPLMLRNLLLGPQRRLWALYLLMIVGFEPAGAQWLLPFCPPGQIGWNECEHIPCTLCDLNGYTGNSGGFGPDEDGDLPNLGFCGPNLHVYYLDFFPAVPVISFTVTTSGCTLNSGITVAIMTVCDGNVGYCEPGNGTNSTTLSVDNLQAGQHQMIIMDFDATGPCNFTITVDPPDATIATTSFQPPDLVINGPASVCPGEEVRYELVPIGDYNGEFDWTGPSGATVNGDPFPVRTADPYIVVRWGNTGGTLCVTPTNFCHQGQPICKTITVAPIPPTIFPPAKVCGGNTSYELPWGQVVSFNGTYTHHLISDRNCDSILQQTVTFLQPVTTNLPDFKLCEDECVNVCGTDFCGYGHYEAVCTAFNGCDSTVVFNISSPNLVADIIGGGAISCAVATQTLNSAPSSGSKVWLNGAGQVIGSGAGITVSMPGKYYLQVHYTHDNHECIVTDSVVIANNTQLPTLLAPDIALNCDSLPTFLHATSNANPALFQWAGPNQFMSNLPNPQVSDSGWYFIAVTDLNNGCSRLDSVWVAPCCTLHAGAFDSTLLTVCGPNHLFAGYHYDPLIAATDSVFFILYRLPADPLGSVLLSSATPEFPFVPGVTQYDSLYFAGAVAGKVLADHSIDFGALCFDFSKGQPVMWLSKPSITVQQAPDFMCLGDCRDVQFQLGGAPPFEFHFDVMQNGQVLYSKTVQVNDYQTTVTICTPDFFIPPGPGEIVFQVNELKDGRCHCSD